MKKPKKVKSVKLKCPECGKVVTCRSTMIDGWYMEQLQHMREEHGARY